MKQFNQSIQIEISVDSIANQLLDQFKDDFKHREIVVEAIIGRALAEDKNALGIIYNSLGGFKREVNYQIGENVATESLYAYAYWNGESHSRGEIKSAMVVKVDPYASRPIKVQYEVPKKDGTWNLETEWVTMDQVSKIPVAPAE